MELSNEMCLMVGILCYLNHPNYLTNSDINCVEDILDKMEERIEDETVKLYELECYYRVIPNENDKLIFLDKINETKTQILNMVNQLIFLKK